MRWGGGGHGSLGNLGQGRGVAVFSNDSIVLLPHPLKSAKGATSVSQPLEKVVIPLADITDVRIMPGTSSAEGGSTPNAPLESPSERMKDELEHGGAVRRIDSSGGHTGTKFVRIVWAKGDDMPAVAIYDRHPDGSAARLYRLIINGPTADGEGDGPEHPILMEPSSTLDDSLARQLRRWLPPRYGDAPWRLAYGTSQHGISMNTLYRRMERVEGPCISFIKDTRGYIFGVFSPVAWRSAGSSYYGTGETFVFTLRPKAHRYPWTRTNSFFLMSSQDCLAVGGGGHFAFYIDSDFLSGSSGPCTTFNSPVLSSSESFKCVFFETWEIMEHDT